ncbi:MAG: ATP-grasp domain-containing protein [Planctomycetes bacterium]|nr:ATP-grasp domain-containing protein [Planctomycetota bacterium]
MQAKELFSAAGLATAPWKVCAEVDGVESARIAVALLGGAVVVKPRTEGSSVGVAIVRDPAELEPALRGAWKYGPDALVERFVPGREFTVAVLGGEALPVIELRPKREFFDYEAKYADQRTEYVVNPSLSPELLRRIQAAGVEAHRALGCEGFSRVDIMVGADGAPVVLEVNTIPGLTERSLFPTAARAAGLAFPDLCERLVAMAVAAAGARTALPA